MFNLKARQETNKALNKQKVGQFLSTKLEAGEIAQEMFLVLKVKPWLFVVSVFIIEFIFTAEQYTFEIFPEFIRALHPGFYFVPFALMGGYREYWLVVTNKRLLLIQRILMDKLNDKITQTPLQEVLTVENKKTALHALYSGTQLVIGLPDKKLVFHVNKQFREEVDHLLGLINQLHSSPSFTANLCRKCGQPLALGIKFCGRCGQSINSGST